jgi:hypothetical protein
MEIELKLNNKPKKPGYYLIKLSDYHRIEVAYVSNNGGSLWMVVSGCVFPLTRGNESLWSDEFTVDFNLTDEIECGEPEPATNP